MSTPLTGEVAPGLEPVRDAFAALLESGAETGGSFVVLEGDRTLVDLCGGWADVARTRAWTPDTLVHVYSVAKPFTALAALTVLHETGTDLDSPLADAWPAYGSHGKRATWRHALTHTAGQPAFPDGLDVDSLTDTRRLEQALAGAPAEAPPGEQIGEHCLTYGHLLGGGVRALTGAGIGPVLRDRVTRPLGLDLQLGVPDADLPRVAELELADPGWAEEVAGVPGTVKHRSLTRPPGALDPAVLNGPAWRRCEFGAIGMHATARGLARAYAAWARPDGPVADLLGPDLWQQSLAPQVTGHDVVIDQEVSWSLTGQVDGDDAGMGGIGGSGAYLTVGGRYAVAYVTRRLADHARMDAVEQAFLAAR